MKRMTFITGHYGSGKSEFSVNLALTKKIHMLIDLDIVNPYFRSRELEKLLSENNVQLVASSVKDSLGSDLPYIAKEAFIPFHKNYVTSVFDLGGDPVGARVLRQFSEFYDEREADLLLCINVYREKTADPEGIISTIREIEESSGQKITGLINNSNFLRDTTYEDLLYGEKVIKKVTESTGLEIMYTGVYEDIIKLCGPLAGEILALKLYLRKKWL
ncbi:MAG: ATP-binding protein [Acholeplasmataceae bacterium]|nr:ATP-binding protein [Acholeplasmataceae bacterium]